MVESLKMDYQILGKSVKLHRLIGQFVILANITIPGIFLCEFLRFRKTGKKLLNG